MRVMVLIKANEDSEAGKMPSEQLLTQMMGFNEELVKAGIMLAGDGLHPSSKGVRVASAGTERKVIDGPFAETKELVAGFWILEVASREEAVTWARRAPLGAGSVLEVRRVVEASDFEGIAPQEVLDAEEVLRERTAERLRERGEGPQG
jgi:hypothetical protein